MNQLCHSLCFEKNLCCKLQDYNGAGIERAKKYLAKVALLKVPTETEFWRKVIEARDLRNIVVHNAGHLDEELHKKHFKIVANNEHLESERFSRTHLNVKQSYLFEIIDAMENFAKEISTNLRNC